MDLSSHFSSTNVQNAVITMDMCYMTLTTNTRTICLDLQNYFDENPHHLLVRPSPVTRTSSIDSELRWGKRNPVTDIRPHIQKASMYRNKWLSKLGVTDKKVNKPSDVKPRWHQVTGNILDVSFVADLMQVFIFYSIILEIDICFSYPNFLTY